MLQHMLNKRFGGYRESGISKSSQDKGALERAGYGAGAAASGAAGLGSLTLSNRLGDVANEMARQDKLREMLSRQAQSAGANLGNPELRKVLADTGDAYSNAIKQIHTRLPNSAARIANSLLLGGEERTWSGVPLKGAKDYYIPTAKRLAGVQRPASTAFFDSLYSNRVGADDLDKLRRAAKIGELHLLPLQQGRGGGVLLSEMLTGLPAAGLGKVNLDPSSREARKLVKMTDYLSRMGVDIAKLTDDTSHAPFSSRLKELYTAIDQVRASGDRKARVAADIVEKVLNQNHMRLYSTAPSAMGAYAANWDMLTGRQPVIQKLVSRLRGAGRVGAGLGALGAGALGYQALTKESQYLDNLTDTQRNIAGGVGAASTAGLLSNLLSNNFQLRRYNPFSREMPKVLLTGGWHEPGAGSSSFVAQRSGLASELRKHLGPENVKEVSGWGDDIMAMSPAERLAAADRHTQIRRKLLPQYDAHIQVGNNARDWVTGSRLRDRLVDKLMFSPQYKGMLRTRLLTDLAEGNLATPIVEWTGKPSGMAARGSTPYHQVFVSGVPEDRLKNFSKNWGIRGKAVATPTLFNDPGPFKGVRYNPGAQGPVTVLSTGGGAGRPLLFHDILERGTTTRKPQFDPTKRTVLDDILEAHRSAHGDKGRVEWHTGLRKDPKTGKWLFPRDPSGALDPVKKIIDHIEANPERFKGLDLRGFIKRPDLAKSLAEAQNIVALPGSTYAELSAMEGSKLPRIASLIPDDVSPDSAKHFRPNSRAFGAMGLGDLAEVNLTDTPEQRVKALAEAMKKGIQDLPDRKPTLPDAEGIAEALRKGVRRIRAKNLLGALGLAGLGATGLGIYKQEKSASTSYLGNIIKNLPRITEGVTKPTLTAAGIVGPAVGIATDDTEKGLHSTMAAGSAAAGLHVAPRAAALELQRASDVSGKDFTALLKRRGLPTAKGILALSLVPSALLAYSEARKLRSRTEV